MIEFKCVPNSNLLLLNKRQLSRVEDLRINNTETVNVYLNQVDESFAYTNHSIKMCKVIKLRCKSSVVHWFVVVPLIELRVEVAQGSLLNSTLIIIFLMIYLFEFRDKPGTP